MSTKPTLYMAGPMTGIPQFNFPAFFAAAEDLRKLGYTIVSPAEMDMEIGVTALASPDGKLKASLDGNQAKTDDGYTFGDFLARDVKVIADKVDGVVCLPGWENSKGARLEVYVSLISNKPVFTYVPSADPLPISFETAAGKVKVRPQHHAAYLKTAGLA